MKIMPRRGEALTMLLALELLALLAPAAVLNCDVNCANTTAGGHLPPVADIDVDTNPAVYPTAYRNESIVERFFNQCVRDPYRALEDPNAEATKNFVLELNNLSRPFFERAPARELIRQTLTRVRSQPQYGGCVTRHGPFFYYWYNPGGLNQSVLYRRRELWEKGVGGGEENGEVFLDPNQWSTDGTSGSAAVVFSWSGNMAAYMVAEKLSDNSVIKVRGGVGR